MSTASSNIRYLHPRRPAIIDSDLLEEDRTSLKRMMANIRRLSNPRRRELTTRMAATDARIAQWDRTKHRRRQWDNDNDVRRASCTFCKGTGQITVSYEDGGTDVCPQCQWANPWLPHDDGIPF